MQQVIQTRMIESFVSTSAHHQDVEKYGTATTNPQINERIKASAANTHTPANSCNKQQLKSQKIHTLKWKVDKKVQSRFGTQQITTSKS